MMLTLRRFDMPDGLTQFGGIDAASCQQRQVRKVSAPDFAGPADGMELVRDLADAVHHHGRGNRSTLPVNPFQPAVSRSASMVSNSRSDPE